MMSRRKLMLTAMMTSTLAGLTVAKQAQAAFAVDPPPPYRGQRVIVTVGNETTFGPVVCYQLHDNPSDITVYSLTTNGSTLDQDYSIRGGTAGDFMNVVRSGLISSCGAYRIGPLNYGANRRLDVRGGSGNDEIQCGAGLSDCFGDAGIDGVQSFSGIGRIVGGANRDFMFGSSAVATDRLSGSSGNDCMDDPMNQHSEFDCGPDNDQYVFPASGRVSCEQRLDMACPNR